MALLLCLSACNIRRPNMVLSNKKMADVLFDYHLATSMMKNRNVATDDEKQAYMDYVFRKHGITEEQFDSSLAWFAKNPNDLMSAYDIVYGRIDAVKKDLTERVAERDYVATARMRGDTVDIWPERKSIRLTGRPFENLITFNISTDEFYQNTDSIEWSMDYHFLNGLPDSSRAAVMMLQLWYDKDSVISTHRTVMEDGPQIMALQSNALGAFKSVQGFIYYPKQDSTKSLLVNNISMMRLHLKHPLPLQQDTIVSRRAVTRGNRAADAETNPEEAAETESEATEEETSAE